MLRKTATARKRAKWDPSLLPGIAAWYVADRGITLNGSTVSQWADQSGNGYHLAQSTPDYQPTYSLTSFNGKPGVTFDGVDDYLSNTSLPAIATGTDLPLTVVIAFNTVVVPSVNNEYIWSFNRSTTIRIDFGMLQSSGNWFFIKQGSIDWADISPKAYDTDRHVVSVVLKRTTMSVWFDGVPTVTDLSVSGVGSMNPDTFDLGTLDSTSLYCSNVRVAGLVVCSGALLQLERETAEAYLMTACGV